MTNRTKQIVRKRSTYNRYPQQVAALQNLLGQFYDSAKNGYSDQAWEEASLNLKRLSGYLHQSEREVLARAWSDFYVSENVEAFRGAIDRVRSGL